MAHEDEDDPSVAATTDAASATATSCRLCCMPSVPEDQRHPIIPVADGCGGTRPGDNDLRDTIVKHLRIQVSDRVYTHYTQLNAVM